MVLSSIQWVYVAAVEKNEVLFISVQTPDIMQTHHLLVRFVVDSEFEILIYFLFLSSSGIIE